VTLKNLSFFLTASGGADMVLVYLILVLAT